MSVESPACSGIGIAEYGARLRRGEFSALEAANACLRRIDALNPKLGAFTYVAHEQARAAAREIDARLATGADQGPLMGVPAAVKDLYYVEGMPLTAGSRLDVAGIVRAEGPVIRALKHAGAIILGKTWTSEFALGGINFVQRVPWNPCDPQVHRTPGGSSGGSAVAVAAGLCTFALGTDTGGSVRMPAALCGVFGHKFSAGALPLDGIFPLSPTLDSPGVFTATARDAVAVWQALGQSVVRTELPLAGLRLAKPAPLFYDELDSQVARAVHAALAALQRRGAEITPVEVPEVAAFEAVFGGIVPVELVDILGRRRVRENLHVFDPVTQARFRAVLDVPPETRTAAAAKQAALRDAVRARTARFDAWVAPTTPLVASPLADHSTLEAALAWNRRALRNTRPGNIFEQCGVSLPLPHEALPVGLQLLCPAMEDAKALAIASAVESALNFPE